MTDRRRLRVVVVGGINRDVLALVSRPPRRGSELAASDVAEGPGGKGANQAAAAARLGADVELVGRVGDDTAGRELRAHLKTARVGVGHVDADPDEATGRAVGIVECGVGAVTAAYAGANAHVRAHHVDAAEELIRHADVVLCQLEVPLAAARRTVELARTHGRLVLVDAAPVVPGAGEVADAADIVTANAGEAEQLTGVRAQHQSSALRAARLLLRGRVRFAAVSAGSAGDVLAWDGGHAWSPAPDVDVVDTTGAGDVLHVALAVQLAAGVAPGAALSFAGAASAIAMTRLGAQAALPDPAQVRALVHARSAREVGAPAERAGTPGISDGTTPTRRSARPTRAAST